MRAEPHEREGDRGRAEGKWVEEKRKGRKRKRWGLVKSEEERERRERERGGEGEREGEEGITQLHVGLMPSSLSVRYSSGMRVGDCAEGAPTLGGKIEYESLMRAISAPLPRPSATHSQTSRLSGYPSWLYLSLYRECTHTAAGKRQRALRIFDVPR